MPADGIVHVTTWAGSHRRSRANTIAMALATDAQVPPATETSPPEPAGINQDSPADAGLQTGPAIKVQTDPPLPASNAEPRHHHDAMASDPAAQSAAPHVPPAPAADDISRGSGATLPPAATVAQPPIAPSVAPASVVLLSFPAVTVASLPAPASIVPLDVVSQVLGKLELTGFATQLADALSNIEQLLTSKVFAETLPLLGNILGTSTDQSLQKAVSAFQVLQSDMVANIQSLAAGSTAQQLADALNAAAAEAGFSRQVSASVVNNDGIDDLVVSLGASGAFSASPQIDTGFGLPGFHFNGPATAPVTLGYTLQQQITVDPNGSLVTVAAQTTPLLAVDLTVGAPLFTADADLGFLKFQASDPKSYLKGTFDVDSDGSVGFQGSANLALNLQTDLGSSAEFPSMSAELDGTWSFGDASTGSFSKVDPADPADFGAQPMIALNNVSVDLGSFLRSFLGPVYAEIKSTLSPIQKFIDFFNDTDLSDFFNGFGITNAEAVKYFDVAGKIDPNSSTGFSGDGKVTPLDLVALIFNQGGTNSGVSGFITALSAIDEIEQIGDSLGLAGGGNYNLGSFTISGDIRKPGFNVQTDTPTAVQDTLADATTLTNALDGVTGLDTGQISDLIDSLVSDAPGAGETDSQLVTIGSPLISNPLSAAELLLGNGSPDIFTLDVQATAESGDPFASPPRDESLLPPGLGIPGIATLALNAAFGAELNLRFGYDTTGLKDFAAGGFADVTQLLNGAYLAPVTVNGGALPLAGFAGDLFAGVTLLDSIDAGGFLNAAANASFATPGKQYLQSLGGNPASLFDLSGTVSAGARIDAQLFGENLFSITPYSTTFFSWDIAGNSNQEPGSPGPIGYADNPGRGELDIEGTRSPSFDPDNFEVQSNWAGPDGKTSFNISNDGSVAYFGLATIGLNALETIDLVNGISKPVYVHNVTIAGKYIDDLQSLDLIGSDADGAILNEYGTNIVSYGTQIPQTELIQTGGLVIIEGTGGDSENYSVMTITNLGFSGGFANLGTIELDGTLGLDSTSKLYGAGTLESENGVSLIRPFEAPTDELADLPKLPSSLLYGANARLDNNGNTILGALDISVPVTNQGTINADSTAGPLHIHNEGTIINSRLLEAAPEPPESLLGNPVEPTTKLIIDTQGTIYNYGGTIAAANGGEVFLNLVTVWGGLLSTSVGNGLYETGIAAQGNVTFDGNLPPATGPDGAFTNPGLDIEGTVSVGGYGFDATPPASTLTLTGLIDTKPYFKNTGSSVVEVIGADSQLLLQDVTLQGGDYVAMPRGTASAGVIHVVGTAAIATQVVLGANGFATSTPGVAFGGDVQVYNGAVLQVSGVIAPDPREVDGALLTTRILLNGGTILADGFAELAQNSATSALLPVIGTLVMADGAANVVGGTGTAAVFKNEWLIEGSGLLGDGSAEVINDNSFQDSDTIFHPAGTIDANTAHSLTLNGGSIGVLNRGLIEASNGGELILTGEVNNPGGTIAATDGSVFIDNGTVAGGLLTSTFGVVDAGGLSEFDGSTSAVTIASSVDLFLGSAADALDELSLKGVIANHGTLQIFGTTRGIAIASVDQYATLTGGGSVLLTDPVAAPGVGHAAISAPVSGYALDNIDNLIAGNGVLAARLTNETAGVIASGNGILSVTGTVANAGLMESASGELYIDGYVQNLDGTVAARGGQVVLSGGTIANYGGLILLSNGALAIGDTGTIEALDLDGKSGTVTLAGLVLGGFIVTDASDSHSIVQAGTAGGTLDGRTYDVAITQGSQVLIGAGDVLTLEGTIDNQATVSVIGNGATATAVISGPVALTGGGSLALSDKSSADSDATQVVSGTNSGSLDNIDNTISGVGLLGAASASITNEAAGSIVAMGGTLVIDAGGTGFINHGQVTAAAASTLVLAGTVFDAGSSLTADAGTIIVQGTVAGGSFATADGGQILSDSGTLDGRANAVTIESGVTFDILAALPSATINNTGLFGTIVNQGEIFLQSDSSGSNNHRSILLTGAVRLTGGGLVALSDLASTGPAATDAILGATGSDTLDNVDNRIVGFGTIAGQTLTNETAGTIDATGGELFLRLFGAGNRSTNQGLIEAVGGTLDLSGTIDTAGGTISVLNDGHGHTGTVLIDGLTIKGGLLTSDLADRASLLAVTTKDGTLDGTASPLTIAPGAQMLAGHDTKLTLMGTIVDQGTIELIGQQSATPVAGAGDADLVIAGTVALNGPGMVLMNHLAGVGQEYGNPVIAGSTQADMLDNAATISGNGTIGALSLTLDNLAQGVIRANGGTLLIDTGYRGGSGRSGAQPVANTGVLTSVATGVLDLESDIANAGGTIGASGTGLTLLDNNIVKGGTFAGDGQVLGSYATIDATASAVTLTTSAQVGVRSSAPGNYTLLTLTGNLVNHGTILIEGTFDNGLGAAEIYVQNTVSLTGGGAVNLINDAASKTASNAFLAGAPNVTQNMLDNVDNLISGTGRLGGTSLVIVNEAAGIISASSGGSLLISTLSSNSIPTAGSVVNKGVIRAMGGTLDVAAGIDNRGGTIEALNDGAGHSGTVSLQGGTITGGTLLSDAGDPASFIQASNYQTTLDGSRGAVTLGTGNTLHIVPDSEVSVTGTIDNLGTVSIFSNTQSGMTPAIIVAGTARLSGGGRVAMSYSGSANNAINGSSGADLLDNVDNTIIGFGRLGLDEMSLTNEAAGRIAAQGGELDLLFANAGDNLTNQGLLEALDGTLQIRGTVANAGGTIAARNDGAGHSGTVDLVSATIQGGALTGDAADPASVFVTTNLSVFDGSASAVTIAGPAQIQNGIGTLVLKGAITDQGTIGLSGQGYYSHSNLLVSGHVILGGGGTIALTDSSGHGGTYQVIAGISGADTLDNTGVTITGVGLLGDGTMTLINEAAGTIIASGGALIVNIGKAVVINHGHMGAVAGGELDITSAINNADGTIGGGGIVLLDNDGTISGGTLAGVIAGDYGTLDGTAEAVTIAAGATVEVISTFPNPYPKPLYLEGTITNQGVMLLRDDDSGLTVRSDLIVEGTVTLNGGGLVSLTGATAKDTGTGNYLTGSSTSDTLDNIDNTIAGFGRLGNGATTLINASGGTVDAVGGVLLVDTAGVAITNSGLMTSGADGVLDLRSSVANAGGTIGADGGTTDLDGINVQGGTLRSSAGGTIELVGKATLDGTASVVVLASDAVLAVANNTTLTLSGAVTDHGVISNKGMIADNAAFILDGTLINDGLLSGGITLSGTGELTNKAGRIVPGAVAAIAAGETIANLGTIAGIVTLAGGDRVITGSGAVFSGGITGGMGGNTLEIATGPYTLSSFDAPGSAQYSTLQIDAGAVVTTNATDLLAGVTLINHGTLNLTGYTAQATVQNGGSIVGDVTLSSGVSLINNAGGTISGGGLAAIEAIGGGASVINDGLIDPASYGAEFLAGGTVTNHAGGVIEGTVAGVAISGGPGTVVNAGTIIGGGPDAVTLGAGFANRVIVSPGAVFTGIVDGGNSAGAAAVSALELSAGAGTLTNIGTRFINFGSIAFDADAHWNLAGNLAGLSGTITGFSAGDTIDIDGITSSGSSYAGDILTLTNGTAEVASLDLPGQFTTADFLVTGDPAGVQIEIACFLAGTLIRTGQREVPVEQLKVGDRVLTLSGESRPIVWIGLGGRQITRGQRCAATPILICRGAFADGTPHSDLRVTKGHSLYLDGVLVPAEFLINHRSIRWDDHAQAVEYFHIELATHDILVANGAAAESYRDDGNRWLFQNVKSGRDLTPQEPCAPVLTGGPIVDSVWRRLLDRAGPRPGFTMTEEPDLHLLIDGRRVDGKAQAGGFHRFRLLDRPDSVRVISRAGAPDVLGIARDPRLLGVAVRQIRLWRGAELRLIEASDPSLDEGFHLFEEDNGFRWSDGDALLPAALFDGINGAFELELCVGGTTRYPLFGDLDRAKAA